MVSKTHERQKKQIEKLIVSIHQTINSLQYAKLASFITPLLNLYDDTGESLLIHVAAKMCSLMASSGELGKANRSANTVFHRVLKKNANTDVLIAYMGYCDVGMEAVAQGNSEKALWAADCLHTGLFLNDRLDREPLFRLYAAIAGFEKEKGQYDKFCKLMNTASELDDFGAPLQSEAVNILMKASIEALNSGDDERIEKAFMCAQAAAIASGAHNHDDCQHREYIDTVFDRIYLAAFENGDAKLAGEALKGCLKLYNKRPDEQASRICRLMEEIEDRIERGQLDESFMIIEACLSNCRSSEGIQRNVLIRNRLMEEARNLINIATDLENKPEAFFETAYRTTVLVFDIVSKIPYTEWPPDNKSSVYRIDGEALLKLAGQANAAWMPDMAIKMADLVMEKSDNLANRGFAAQVYLDAGDQFTGCPDAWHKATDCYEKAVSHAGPNDKMRTKAAKGLFRVAHESLTAASYECAKAAALIVCNNVGGDIYSDYAARIVDYVKRPRGGTPYEQDWKAAHDEYDAREVRADMKADLKALLSFMGDARVLRKPGAKGGRPQPA